MHSYMLMNHSLRWNELHFCRYEMKLSRGLLTSYLLMHALDINISYFLFRVTVCPHSRLFTVKYQSSQFWFTVHRLHGTILYSQFCHHIVLRENSIATVNSNILNFHACVTPN